MVSHASSGGTMQTAVDMVEVDFGFGGMNFFLGLSFVFSRFDISEEGKKSMPSMFSGSG